MDRRLKQWIAPALVTLGVHASGGFVCADSGDFQTQLNKLKHALDQAEAANAAVRTELDEAITQNTDQWLTQERAATISSLVQQVLADSDSLMNLQGNNTMMGWNDGFFLASADGQFLLKIGGLMQARTLADWIAVRPIGNPPVTDYDQWRYGFEMPRTQLNFGGHAFGRGLEYYIETGWGRFDPHVFTANLHLFTFRLWDTWIKFRINQELSVKIGQFQLPFSRESLVRPQYQLAVERTLIDRRMGLGRSAAIELTWASDHRRFKIAHSNGSASLFHNAIWGQQDPVPPHAALGRDTLYSITMRHEWKVLGDWEQFNQFTSPPGSERGVLIGIAGHRQNNENVNALPIGGVPDGLFWGVTGDVTLQFDGASLFGAVIYERVTDFNIFNPRTNWLGFVAQGSTYISNRTELFARWESGGPDQDAFGDNEMMIMTVGVNHYLDGQELKLSADLGFSFGDVSRVMLSPAAGWQFDSNRSDQAVLRTQLQLMF